MLEKSPKNRGHTETRIVTIDASFCDKLSQYPRSILYIQNNAQSVNNNITTWTPVILFGNKNSPVEANSVYTIA